MASNLDRYKKDLDSLVANGRKLYLAMRLECFPDQFDAKAKKIFKALPSTRSNYQSWYSEAKAIVRQLLPDRLSDFVGHYEKPRGRKDLSCENYRVEDYLLGLQATRERFGEKEITVGLDAAVPHFAQQLSILESVKVRFEISLFDIRQLVQADLLDSELDAAEELVKKKFTRAAGALAGVVLERHLALACDNHGVTTAKKAPTISELNDALKNADVIDLPQWRFVQHLADIRNLCDHAKKVEPSPEQVSDLVAGVMKITKTLY